MADGDQIAGFGEALPPDLDDTITVEIPQDDGSVIINYVDEAGEAGDEDDADDTGHFANLAEKLRDGDLFALADDILQGINEDLVSRRDWEETYINGMTLMGLKLDEPKTASTGGGVESQSNVYHQVLLESVVRFWATAQAELLPAAGPAKVQNDDPQAMADDNELAQALEKDFNHFLTTVDAGYYPDTNRMLFRVGFGGMGFKKVYSHPIKRRPISESVNAEDMIISHDAKSVDTAARVTQRIMMRHGELIRYQLAGEYRDIDVSQPVPASDDKIGAKIKETAGISPRATAIPSDFQHTIYECYTERDLPGHEHKKRGKYTGLPLPYVITIDKDSRIALSVRRNWREDDEDFKPIERYVPFGYVPGFGLYSLGLVHLLGNVTRALTTAERVLLDAGMFNNYPGGVISDTASRQEKMTIVAGLGQFAQVKTGGQPIGQIVMPWPYKAPDAVFMQMLDKLAGDAGRLGGTAEIPVGEGRQDMPVGTTLAVIDQAIKVVGAVHKGLHQSQRKEFRLLQALFADNPQALWEGVIKPNRKWSAAEEVSRLNLVPAADPNVPSQFFRIMQAVALVQLAVLPGSTLDRREVERHAIEVVGMADADKYQSPPIDPSQIPDPNAKPQDPSKILSVIQKGKDTQTRAMTAAMQGQQKAAQMALESADKAADRASHEKIALIKEQSEVGRLMHEVAKTAGLGATPEMPAEPKSDTGTAA